MQILFDREMLNFKQFSKLPKEELAPLMELKNFIQQRVAVLHDQIEKEESKDDKCCIIIHILSGEKTGKVEFNYSDELSEK